MEWCNTDPQWAIQPGRGVSWSYKGPFGWNAGVCRRDGSGYFSGRELKPENVTIAGHTALMGETAKAITWKKQPITSLQRAITWKKRPITSLQKPLLGWNDQLQACKSHYLGETAHYKLAKAITWKKRPITSLQKPLLGWNAQLQACNNVPQPPQTAHIWAYCKAAITDGTLPLKETRSLSYSSSPLFTNPACRRLEFHKRVGKYDRKAVKL